MSELVARTRRSVPGSRNSTLFEVACRAGELVARGAIDWQIATDALRCAALSVGLDELEILGVDGRSGTITKGLETGFGSMLGRRR